ncbi:MAG: acetate/propionate family kinase [Rhodoferax sp.]|uniref:acetate/propionate family kinase n=1 Tax=Rhodoferax sp. TaxID=50421 RepID=UPI0014002F55|nr:acetate/propionate family kinase [Rhodoferax sp.]NDP39849.1 acetate/propionate family kinase [Rhodoferax sp.]
MAILSVNAGSSTLKFSLHPLQSGQVQASVLTGSIQGLEPGGAPVLDWSFCGQAQHRQLERAADPFEQALHNLGELLRADPAIPAIEAIAHRVVHGGRTLSASVIVTEVIMTELIRLTSLAPLHQPQNLQGIRAFQKAFPELPQIACFDTAFHATLPEVDSTFALPQALTAKGVRRYGFHGLSYQYVMSVLLERSEQARGRVLMAHLGNGASLCAARGGLSCSTSMGFSALDGLMMGTRTGSIDPGVLLYLMEQGWDHDQLETLLYKQSGLLGVSGLSADMRTLRANGSAPAQAAIDLFTYRLVREAGAMVACLDGLDLLAFSGGIGEHDTELRAQMGQRLAWLGVVIDPQLNSQATGNEVLAIHAPQSRVQVWVVPTDEGLVAAREAARLI